MHLHVFKYAPDAAGGDSPVVDAGTPAAAPSEEGSAAVPAATEASAAASPEWNGEVEAIKALPWWEQVPEAARGSIENGLRTVRKGWQSAYDKHRAEKVAPLEKSVADLTKQLAAAQNQRTLFSDLLAEDEKNGPLVKQIEGLTASLAATQAERDEYKSKAEKFEAERTESATVDYMRGHETKYPDIYADFEVDDAGNAKGAYARFVKLLDDGEAEDVAAEMVRVLLAKKVPPPVATPAATPAAPAPRTVTLPPSVANMQRSGPQASGASRERIETFEEVKRRIAAQAASE